jgi:hypothetical protein
MAELINPPKMITSRRDAIIGESARKNRKWEKTPARHGERDQVD